MCKADDCNCLTARTDYLYWTCRVHMLMHCTPLNASNVVVCGLCLVSPTEHILFARLDCNCPTDITGMRLCCITAMPLCSVMHDLLYMVTAGCMVDEA